MIGLILIALLTTGDVKPATMPEIRVSFFQAATEIGQREDFFEMMESMPKKSAIVKVYYGAAQAMMAEVVFNPYTKLNHFVEGKNFIEEAIAERPEEAELRYVRYLIQSNAPDFLDYNKDIPDDLKFICAAIEQANEKESWMFQFLEYRSLQKAKLDANGKS